MKPAAAQEFIREAPSADFDRQVEALVMGSVRVAAVLLCIILIGLSIDWLAATPPLAQAPLSLAGLGLMGVGVLLEAWATAVFWNIGGGTPNPMRPPVRLVTRGPYRMSRNPLYVARLAILAGSSIFLRSWGVFILTLLLFLILQIKVPREERRLEARFAMEYDHYRARTRRWISLRRPASRPQGTVLKEGKEE